MHLIGRAGDAPGAAWSAHDGALGQVEGGRGIGRVALRRPRRRSQLKEGGLAIAAASEAIRVIKRHRDCHCERIVL